MDEMRESLLHQFTALPRLGTPAQNLTDRDKVALAIAVGAPCECVMEGSMMTVRTTVSIGVIDRGDGGWIVCTSPLPQRYLTPVRHEQVIAEARERK